jgi:hypothetical protein
MDPHSDPDAAPDPAIFVFDLQDNNKKLICLKKFFCLLLFQVHLHKFLTIKSPKEVTIEGSGSGSGSIPITSGFGSGRPKNI